VKQARVVNLTRGTVLAERASVADSFVTRFLGLMGRAPLPPGAGLVLIPGGAVHNFFVRQTLDVLHLAEGGRVTHVVAGLKPWRLGPLGVGGAATVELPPGTAERSGTRAGDVIDIQRHT
jgi:uncharacterized membrane protein (UPF0127 family)